MEEWVMTSSSGDWKDLSGGLRHDCLNQIDWFKITYLGEVVITLGIKSWFAEVGLSTSDSTWGPISSFFFSSIYKRMSL